MSVPAARIPTDADDDMIVIGSGPSGRRAAVRSARLGKSVPVVERGFRGRSCRAKSDIAAGDLMVRLHETRDHEVEVLEHRFSRNGVRTARGAARLVDPAPAARLRR